MNAQAVDLRCRQIPTRVDHDRGFTAWEDNKYMSRPLDDQKTIAKTTKTACQMCSCMTSNNAGNEMPMMT